MAERHDGGGGGGGGKGGKILSMTVKRARRVQEKVRIIRVWPSSVFVFLRILFVATCAVRVINGGASVHAAKKKAPC